MYGLQGVVYSDSSCTIFYASYVCYWIEKTFCKFIASFEAEHDGLDVFGVQLL